MTVYRVSNAAEFQSALKTIRAGDEVRLAPGEYAHLKIQNLSLPGSVTITSADARHPVVITDLVVKNSSNLVFRSLEFSAGAKDMNTVLVFQSHDVLFDQVEVHGPAGLGSKTASSPFMIRSSQNVTVQTSEFHDLWHAIAMLDTSGTVIRGNSFHDLRTDGVRGGGNSNLLVEGNLFTDFNPAKGDHADAVQLWSTNQTKAAHDIVIRGNLVVRGDGAPVQGVFIRDTFDKLPFRNVTVEGNTILGGAYNGLTIDGVIGGSVKGNTVLGYADQRSWIRLVADHGLKLSGNTATFFNLENKADPRLAANSLVEPSEAASLAAVRAWMSTHRSEAGHWASDLAHLIQSGVEDVLAPTSPIADTVSGLTSTKNGAAVEAGIQRLAEGDTLLRVHDGATGHGNSGNNRLIGTGRDDVLYGHGGQRPSAGIDRRRHPVGRRWKGRPAWRRRR